MLHGFEDEPVDHLVDSPPMFLAGDLVHALALVISLSIYIHMYIPLLYSNGYDSDHYRTIVGPSHDY